MVSMITSTLIALTTVTLTLTAVISTVIAVAKDGYRPTDTDESRIPDRWPTSPLSGDWTAQ